MIARDLRLSTFNVSKVVSHQRPYVEWTVRICLGLYSVCTCAMDRDGKDLISYFTCPRLHIVDKYMAMVVYYWRRIKLKDVVSEWVHVILYNVKLHLKLWCYIFLKMLWQPCCILACHTQVLWFMEQLLYWSNERWTHQPLSNMEKTILPENP